MLLRIVSATFLFWVAFHLMAGTLDDEIDQPVLKENPTAEYRKTHEGIALFRFTEDRKIYWWVQNITPDWVCVWTKVTKRGHDLARRYHLDREIHECEHEPICHLCAQLGYLYRGAIDGVDVKH